MARQLHHGDAGDGRDDIDVEGTTPGAGSWLSDLLMPGPVDDSSASDGADPVQQWSVPSNVNDHEFARTNRLFCDFIHRGIIPHAHGDREGSREEIVAYV
jgi:hypothetical protein